MVAVAYRRLSFTRGSNYKALTRKMLGFWVGGRLLEVVAYERWLHMEARLYIGPLGSLEVSLALSVLYYFFFFFEKSNNHNYMFLLFLSFLSLSSSVSPFFSFFLFVPIWHILA